MNWIARASCKPQSSQVTRSIDDESGAHFTIADIANLAAHSPLLSVHEAMQARFQSARKNRLAASERHASDQTKVATLQGERPFSFDRIAPSAPVAASFCFAGSAKACQASTSFPVSRATGGDEVGSHLLAEAAAMASAGLGRLALGLVCTIFFTASLLAADRAPVQKGPAGKNIGGLQSLAGHPEGRQIAAQQPRLPIGGKFNMPFGRFSTPLQDGAQLSSRSIVLAGLALDPHAFTFPAAEIAQDMPHFSHTGMSASASVSITRQNSQIFLRASSRNAGGTVPNAPGAPRASLPVERDATADRGTHHALASEPADATPVAVRDSYASLPLAPVSRDILPPPRPVWLPHKQPDVSVGPKRREHFAAPAPARQMLSGFRRISTNEPGVFGSVAVGMHHVADRSQWERVLAENAAGFFTEGCPGHEQICDLPGWQQWQKIYRQARVLDRREQINFVNSKVNRLVRYADDDTLYEQVDHWARLEETVAHGAGDCEDYAIAKMWLLRALGVPESSLQLVVVRDSDRGLDHAVLAVYFNNDILILDNLHSRVISHEDMLHYRPVYSFAQEASYIHGVKHKGSQQLAQNETFVTMR